MNRRSLLGSALLSLAALLKWPRSIGSALADDKNWRHGVSLFGNLKYPAGFRHFEPSNRSSLSIGTAASDRAPAIFAAKLGTGSAALSALRNTFLVCIT